MGLKCSLFGHAFDERDVVRERDSTGSEVVTVVKDVERCTQCGTTRVVSTNKEVVSAAGATADGGVDAGATLRTPGADTGDGTDPDAFDATDQPGAAGDGPGTAVAEPGGDGGGFAGDASDSADEAFDETGFEASGDDPAAGGTADPAEEDATILSDDDPDGTTVLGNAAEGTVDATEPSAPEAAPTETGSEAADPPTETGSEDADPTTEDAEILTDDEPGDRAPGRWPGEEAPDAWEPEPLDDRSPSDTEHGDAADADEGATEVDADTETAAEDDGGAPETTAEPAPDIEPAATASFTVPDGHYRCGECGHTIPASSSFRRGDACPECVHGYLEAGE
jgi:hypothetical protein